MKNYLYTFSLLLLFVSVLIFSRPVEAQEGPSVSIAWGSNAVEDTTDGSFTISISQSPETYVDVYYRQAIPGDFQPDALEGVDFAKLTPPVRFEAGGPLSTSIPLIVLPDRIVEGDEFVTIEINDVFDPNEGIWSIDPSTTVITIVDNDFATATFEVIKDFTDNNSEQEVQITLSCQGADVVAPATKSVFGSGSVTFDLTNVGVEAECKAVEAVPLGYTWVNSEACSIVPIAADSVNSCTMINSPRNEATFTVSKIFTDNADLGVSVTLSCQDADVLAPATRVVSGGGSVTFDLANVGVEATCTAIETVPLGYTWVNSEACSFVPVDTDSPNGCDIINSPESDEIIFTVHKVFEDRNQDLVSVSLSCIGVTVQNSPQSASEMNPAEFLLTAIPGWDGGIPTCTAVETVPDGYTWENPAACDEVPLGVNDSNPELGISAFTGASCRILNKPITETTKFTVHKDFSDNNTDSVLITLECTNAGIDNPTLPASESAPAVFFLTPLSSSNRCTATEEDVPEGYEKDESACASVSIDVGGTEECTIFNQKLEPPPPDKATFTVSKTFTDDADLQVDVTLDCRDADIVGPATRPVAGGGSVTFELSNVGSEAVCTATESDIEDYNWVNPDDCSDIMVTPDTDKSCEMINEPIPKPPEDEFFTVTVEFNPASTISVEVTLDCSNAEILDKTLQASTAEPAVFELSNVGEDNVCTATQEVPEGYLVDERNCTEDSTADKNNCQMNNISVKLPEPPGGGGNNPVVFDYVLSTCQFKGDGDQHNAADYQAQCDALIGAALSPDPAENAAAAVATKEITPDDTVSTRSTGMQTTMVQISAVDGRLGTLRGGGGAGFSASGFSMSFADAMVNGDLLKSFISGFDQNIPAFMQANATQNTDSGFIDQFGRWGVWVSGRLVFGKKDLTSYQIDYDFDTAGLTFGMDYRFTDQFVAGIAVGYANTDADIGSDNGKLDTDGYSVSLYGTWFQSDRFYMGGSLGYGSNDYDQRRNVRYKLDPGSNQPFVNIDQTMTAEYDGNQFSAAFTGGWDFNKNGWTFGPTFRLNYVEVDVDSFNEILIQNSVGPIRDGWAAHIDDQSYKSLQPAIGFEFSKPVSRQWGVIIPQGYIDVVSELKDGSTLITGSFLGAGQTDKRFSMKTDDFEETFARGGLGLGFIFKNNKSAFLMADADIGRDILKTYYINAGFRWQF
jgi:outer membrane autotransporter protein